MINEIFIKNIQIILDIFIPLGGKVTCLKFFVKSTPNNINDC
jgi:hypothetical protein